MIPHSWNVEPRFLIKKPSGKLGFFCAVPFRYPSILDLESEESDSGTH